MNATAPITAGQYELILKLLGELGQTFVAPQIAHHTATAADELIEHLQSLQRRAVRPLPPVAREGYYLLEGDVIMIRPTRGGNYMNGLRMVVDTGARKGTWVYEGDLASRIAHSDQEPLTVSQAAALGHQHGVCMVCGAGLTRPRSVAMGIGPVCAKKL